MKIEAQQPIFAPVTITLESEGELRFFFDTICCTSNHTDEVYGLPHETLWKTYQQVKEVLVARGLHYKNVRTFNMKEEGEV